MAYDRIDELEQEIKKKQEELDILRTVKEQYPSLQSSRGRWGYIRYYASEINSEVDEVSIHYSCGCCSDASLYARPYKVVNGLKVFSDPPYFCVGGKTDYRGDEPDIGWENKLREKNIPENVIQKIQDHFDKEAKDHEWDNDDENDDSIGW